MARAKYLRLGDSSVGGGAPHNDNAPVVTMTRGEFGAMVREAVEAALEKQTPLLVDRQGLARVLGVSAGHVDALRKQGLPAVMVGASPRFEPAAVIEWLRKAGAA